MYVLNRVRDIEKGKATTILPICIKSMQSLIG